MTTETKSLRQVFPNAPEEILRELSEKAAIKHVERGASIYLQGERAHSFFIVLDGWVKLYRVSKCGSEAITAVLARHNCFGLAAGLSEASYSTGAECASRTTLLQIDARTLRFMIEKDVWMARSYLAASMKTNRNLVRQVEQLKSSSGAQRIAKFLVELCDCNQDDCIVVLPFEKVLIAGTLGMKPESLSRAFRRLNKFGVTIKKDRALIQSMTRLRTFIEEDPAESWHRSVA